jgi:hypothetical protein
MAKKTASSRVARNRSQLRQNLADLLIETLREFAPRSTQRFINSNIELMEAHREFLAERIARLERARARVSKQTRRTASRRVPVRRRRASRAAKSAA